MGNGLLYRELKSVMLGHLIAEGSTRSVYSMAHDPNFVVKIERAPRRFQNVNEWEMWNWAIGTDKQKWLADCLCISTCGLMLVQRRITPMRKGERPKKIPDFLTDIKAENFGHLEGEPEDKIVCIDYGTVWAGIQDHPIKMITPKWRD